MAAPVEKTFYQFEKGFVFTEASAKEGLEKLLPKGWKHLELDDTRLFFDADCKQYEDKAYIKTLVALFDGAYDYEDGGFRLFDMQAAVFRTKLSEECQTKDHLDEKSPQPIVIIKERYDPVDHCVISLNDNSGLPKFTSGKLLRRHFLKYHGRTSGSKDTTEVEDYAALILFQPTKPKSWDFAKNDYEPVDTAKYFYDVIHCGEMLKMDDFLRNRLRCIRMWKRIGVLAFAFREVPDDLLLDYSKGVAGDPYRERVFPAGDASYEEMYNAPYEKAFKSRSAFILPLLLAFLLQVRKQEAELRFSQKLAQISTELCAHLKTNPKLVARGWEGIFFSFMAYFLANSSIDLSALKDFRTNVRTGQFELLRNNGTLHTAVRKTMEMQLLKRLNPLVEAMLIPAQRALKMKETVLMRAFCTDRVFFHQEKEEEESLLLASEVFLDRPYLFTYLFVPPSSKRTQIDPQGSGMVIAFSPYTKLDRWIEVMLLFLYFSPRFNTTEVQKVIARMKRLAKNNSNSFEFPVKVLVCYEAANWNVLEFKANDEL